MSLLDIVKFPEPVLSREAEEVKDINADLEKLVMDMAETMYHAPGVGLAANQVGIPRKIAIIDVSESDEAKNTMVLVNPRIVQASEDKDVMEEGCLSVPDFQAEVERALHVTVAAKNLKGEDVEIEASGFLARVVQHEVDHLYGNLFIDRIGKLKRDRYVRQRKKALQKDKNLL
ncbi:MAG: peptide deformylase [bacterium]